MTNSGHFDEHGEIELREEFIVLAIPAETVEVTISAVIYHDGELMTVTKTMGMQDVREAIREAQDGYIPSDAMFSLTPMGEQQAEELINRYRDDEEEDGDT